VLGVSGAQGSGKTTFTGQLASCLAERGFAVATLSLDDFYLTQVERAALARDKHPLFATLRFVHFPSDNLSILSFWKFHSPCFTVAIQPPGR
jgi:hypothetical protein